MICCNVIFKIVIKFVNWLGKNDVFWYFFNELLEVNGLDIFYYVVDKKFKNLDFDL